MAYESRKEVLSRLRALYESGTPIVGTGAGTGLTAKAERCGGADVVIVYGTGKYRMAGRSSMGGRFAFGDANGLVLRMAREVMPVCADVPVFCGVFVQDPFRDMKRFLLELREAGYSGVQNVPGMGGMDQMEGDAVVAYLNAKGIGVEMELDFLRIARENDTVISPYAYNLEQCIEMAQIGADVIVCHAGLTMKGLTAAKIAPPLDRCVEMLTEWRDAIHRENPDTIILCHGGPIAEPEDYAYVHKYVPKLAGFYGASSIERIPVETDVMHTVREYKSLSLLSSGARGSSTGGGNRAV